MSSASQFTLSQCFQAITAVAIAVDAVRRYFVADAVFVSDQATYEQIVLANQTFLIALIEVGAVMLFSAVCIYLNLRRRY